MIEQVKPIEERDIIERFDKVIFNLDMMKSYHNPEDRYILGLVGLKRFPEKDEIFSIRRTYCGKDGELWIAPCTTKYTKPEDINKAMSSCMLPAKYVQQIFWYDGGNGKLDKIGGWHKGWQKSNCIAKIFVPSLFSDTLFKEWNWVNFRKYIKYDKKTNQHLIINNLGV